MKVRRFVECLGKMAVVCEEADSDLLSYTRLWIERVNRGSLFPLDETFHFFVQLETVVRVLLPKHIVKVRKGCGVAYRQNCRIEAPTDPISSS